MEDRIPFQDGKFSIRRGKPADIDRILRHRRSMFLDMGYRDERVLREVDEVSRPFFAARLSDGTYLAWLAETRDGLCVAGGGIMLFDHVPSPRDPHPLRPLIVSMYTEPQFRRMGLARKLMEIMVAWCRSEGYGSITLYASDDGRPLYASLGFVATNELRLMLREPPRR